MKATIEVDHDPRIITLFAPEDKDIGRASYTITENDDTIVFTITADDAASLRAVFNGIAKLLHIWEETGKL